MGYRTNYSPPHCGGEGSRWSFAAENRWKKERVTTNNFTKDVAWREAHKLFSAEGPDFEVSPLEIATEILASLIILLVAVFAVK